mgnify:CR=1 FL=1
MMKMTNNDTMQQQELLKCATKVLGNKEEAEHWLSTPKRALGGEIPTSYALSAKGGDEVRSLLNRIEHGVFS